MQSQLMNERDLAAELRRLIDDARRLAPEVGPDLDQLLQDGLTHPLAAQELESLLGKVIERIREGAGRRADDRAEAVLANGTEELLRRVSAIRERTRVTVPPPGPMVKQHTVHLLDEHNGIRSRLVVPRPVFHQKEVPMVGGFIQTNEIKLWSGNERLDIHVNQFRAKNGRAPSAEELHRIMLGKLPLEGLGTDDEFEILDLARSIAANGVRKPPILDVDGTLLDGNRRVAACHLILNDTDEFGAAEAKRRAEYVFVWQLTPDATDDDRRRVIVSLNFESDCKEPWPEYVKARKVFEEWEAMLQLETQKPGPKRQAEMKKELSRKYALGPDTTVVNRYLKMVRWALEFEDHHINTKNRDPYEVKHAASRYFQYFEELGKGEQSPGGVGWTLNNDDGFRGVVFDLLFDGKIESWKEVRALKHVYASEEAGELLAKAHHEPNVEAAHQHVESAITIANTKRAEMRSLGANLRIETFTKWIEDVPPRTFRDEVKTENLQGLLRALRLIEPIVQQSLENREGPSALGSKAGSVKGAGKEKKPS